MLGPLLNPAGAVYGLIGVYSPDISMLMAQALQQLGTKKALVVHSQVHCTLPPAYLLAPHSSCTARALLTGAICTTCEDVEKDSLGSGDQT